MADDFEIVCIFTPKESGLILVTLHRVSHYFLAFFFLGGRGSGGRWAADGCTRARRPSILNGSEPKLVAFAMIDGD